MPGGACVNGGVNVIVAISDGDNLAIPTNRYIWQNFWRSEFRGRISMGWSFAFGLNFIAPAIADYYLSTRTSNDKLAGMLGIGYVHPSYYPDKDFFLTQSFQIMQNLGLMTFWTLDPCLYSPDSPVWRNFYENPIEGIPSGILMGYFPIFGPRHFRTADDIPVIVASGSYEDGPQDIALRIRKIIDKTPSERPPVIFFSASVWSNSLDDLVQSLEPLKQEGVNFPLPSEALRCVP